MEKNMFSELHGPHKKKTLGVQKLHFDPKDPGNDPSFQNPGFARSNPTLLFLGMGFFEFSKIT